MQNWVGAFYAHKIKRGDDPHIGKMVCDSSSCDDKIVIVHEISTIRFMRIGPHSGKDTSSKQGGAHSDQQPLSFGSFGGAPASHPPIPEKCTAVVQPSLQVFTTFCFTKFIGSATVLFLFFLVVMEIQTNPGATIRGATIPSLMVEEEESASSMERIDRLPLSFLEEESMALPGESTLPELDLIDPPLPSWEEWIAMRRPTMTLGEESKTSSSRQTTSQEGLEAVQTLPETKSRSLGSLCNTNEILHPPLPGKKGAAFTLRKEGQTGSWVENLPKVVRLNPYWNYSWGHARIAQQPDHIEFVPMIWGYFGSVNLNSIMVNHIQPQIQNGQAKRLLTYNEPDNPLQANLSVERALEAWPTLEQTNLPLVSPSCQHPERQWMQSFASNIDTGCMRMEWVGVHWYGGVSFEKFQKAMETFHDLYQRPLLVTEFAPADWTAQTIEENQYTEAMVLDFMKQALPWLEVTPWIAGYTWFPFQPTDPPGTSSALLDQEGELTTCGRYYASITTETPQGDLRIGTDQDPILTVAPMGFAVILAFLCSIFGATN